MYDIKGNEKLAKYSIFSEQNHFNMPKNIIMLSKKGLIQDKKTDTQYLLKPIPLL